MPNSTIHVTREELNHLLGEPVGQRKIDVLWDNLADMWIFFLDEVEIVNGLGVTDDATVSKER